MMEMIGQFRWQDGVDIGIITFLIYRLLQILRGSRELVESVFLPHSPIHDGALVIQKGRVTAVRCLLPLSTNPNLKKSWGTRHRAALGVTEETDAIAVVISEQEGAVALIVGGNVTENIDGARLRSALRELIKS